MIYWIVRFINTYRQYVILAILILASLLILSLNSSKEITSIRKVSFIFYGIIDFFNSPLNDFSLAKKELELLRKENADLSRQLIELKQYSKERNELIELLNFEKANPITYLTAKIILKSNDASGNKFVINKGTKDGVKLNATVFNSRGLVGFISDLTANYSVVKTIDNLNLRISVRNERTGATGILSWDGEKFKVYNVNKSADVKEGDIFVTSEYSSLFPPGIPAAIVTYAFQTQETLFYDITAKSASDLTNINFCLVEITDLEKQKLVFLVKRSEH